jgi:hypothetical protein
MPPRWSLILLAILVSLGCGLRVWQAHESLWVDELHTAWCAGGSLAEVAPRAAIGNQSSLFFWLEWLLVQVGGASELALRLPSLIAGTLLPAALYGLGWRWTRSNLAALAAAALVVVDPRSIFYATEARPYALVELLAAVHVAVFLEVLMRPSLALRVAFVLGAALLFHLHYTSVLFVAAEIGFWLLARAIDSEGIRYKPAWLLIDLFYLCVLAAPAAWNVAAIAGRRENWTRFVPDRPATDILFLLPWSAAILFVLVDVDTFLRKSVPAQGRPTVDAELPTLLLSAWLLIPVAAAWLLTIFDVARLFATRYVIASAPAAILIAALVTRLPPWPHTRVTLAAALIGLTLWSGGFVPQLHTDGRLIADRRENWRSAITWLNEQLPGRRLPVLVRSGLIEADELRSSDDPLLRDYCLLPVTSIYRLHARQSDLVSLPYSDAGWLEPEVRQLVRERAGMWLVNRSSEASSARVERGLIASLDAAEPRRSTNQRWRVVESRSFGTIQVRRIARTSET